MEGNTPAPWFLEENGQKRGPFTSQQIMKLVMEGALKLESRIFDSEANAWKIAADVVPFLDLGGKEEKSWQPPPRPPELRDQHVVDLNADATGGIDYFALISDRKREIERARAATRVQTSRELDDESRRRGAPTQPVSVQPQTQSRSLLTASRRTQPPKIVRVAPPLESQSASASATPPSPPLSDGILSAEVDAGPGIGRVINIFSRVTRYAREHKSAISIAAALSFVFIGTYGVVKTIAERKGREPAAKSDLESTEPAKNPARSLDATPTSKSTTTSTTSAPSNEGLGSGRNRVARGGGSVSHRNVSPDVQFSRVVPGMPLSPSTNTAPSEPPPRDPPQYYSSSENAADSVAISNAANTMVTPPSDYNPNDPNNGIVQPPGFIPPPADPNQDPNRVPTAEPSPVTPYTQ